MSLPRDLGEALYTEGWGPKVFGVPAFKLWWCDCIIPIAHLGRAHVCEYWEVR